MAPTSLEGRRRMEQEVMLAYLLQLNRYALENELITKEIYKKMEISMIQKYGTKFSLKHIRVSKNGLENLLFPARCPLHFQDFIL